MRVASAAPVGQYGRRGSGQRDRCAGRSAGGGVERAVVAARRERDRVAGPGIGKRRGQLRRGRDVDGTAAGAAGGRRAGRRARGTARRRGGRAGRARRSGAGDLQLVHGEAGAAGVLAEVELDPAGPGTGRQGKGLSATMARGVLDDGVPVRPVRGGPHLVRSGVAGAPHDGHVVDGDGAAEVDLQLLRLGGAALPHRTGDTVDRVGCARAVRRGGGRAATGEVGARRLGGRAAEDTGTDEAGRRDESARCQRRPDRRPARSTHPHRRPCHGPLLSRQRRGSHVRGRLPRLAARPHGRRALLHNSLQHQKRKGPSPLPGRALNCGN